MGLIEIALTFLIILLSVFLAITGTQVFFILRDLKKALDRLNGALPTTPAKISSKSPKSKRFYKKVL